MSVKLDFTVNDALKNRCFEGSSCGDCIEGCIISVLRYCAQNALFLGFFFILERIKWMNDFFSMERSDQPIFFNISDCIDHHYAYAVSNEDRMSVMYFPPLLIHGQSYKTISVPLTRNFMNFIFFDYFKYFEYLKYKSIILIPTKKCTILFI